MNVTISGNSSAIANDYTVELYVVPCEITASTISDMTTEVGN